MATTTDDILTYLHLAAPRDIGIQMTTTRPALVNGGIRHLRGVHEPSSIPAMSGTEMAAMSLYWRMRPIPPGAKGTFTLRVMPAHLANQFKDAMLPQVFATPMMITAMENAALNAIRSYLDPGESAVGTAVDIRHLAATPVGHEVTAEAEVTHVDGRRIVFNVSARDETEEIGRGTHERMVVDMRRLGERLAAKSKPKT